MNRFKTALAIQNAGNPRAIARALVDAFDASANDGAGTAEQWRDPAARLILFALMEKAGLGLGDFNLYMDCADKCRRLESLAPVAADND